MNIDTAHSDHLGGERGIGNHSIRASMVTNLEASGKKAPLYTFGARFNFCHFYTDLNYGNGNNQKSAVLRIGLRI